jgi:hypothetical protein
MIRLLAHQGGWDEALLFLTPLAIAFIVINAFERRGRRQRGMMDQAEPPDRKQDTSNVD